MNKASKTWLKHTYDQKDMLSIGQLALEFNQMAKGIPANHLPHIFTRFYRVDISGRVWAEGAALFDACQIPGRGSRGGM